MPQPNINDIVILGTSEAEIFNVKKGPDRLISGDPDITNSVYFRSQDRRFTSGIWESTPGKFVCVYEEDEFYYMLSGKVVITDSVGNSKTFVPGDSIVVPAGFTGQWEVVETTKKFFAHYMPD